jgi:uncharacterized RDD family membrane protein YckC
MATNRSRRTQRPSGSHVAPRRFAPYRIARFILIARALIATVAIAFLVLGLLNVHAVTNHFRIN